MNRDFLKGLGLEDDAINKIMAEHGKTVTAVTSERDSLKTQLEQTNTQFEALKESTKGDADLQDKLKTLEAERDKAKTDAADQLTAAQKGFAIDLALRDAGARNPKSVRALLDEDKLDFKDGKLANLKDQLDPIQKDNDFLFQEAKPKPNFSPHGNPNPNGENAGKTLVEKIQARLSADN